MAESNPFGSAAMAAGYASSRPSLHRPILDRALGRARVGRALDVGCGSGLSTRALSGLAARVVGIEPAEAMLGWARSVAPEASFVVGRAEALPFADGSFDLLTAAGSLNYVAGLKDFFREAARVSGRLVVYDFRPGRSFPDSDELDRWFEAFVARYPWPASEARPLNPELLAGIDSGFQLARSENFRIGLTLTPDFYLDYMMTESNVAYALRSGVAENDIRTWCAESLAPVWQGRPREVVFGGYWAEMKLE